MSAQLARNIEVRAAAYVHSGVDSIRDILKLLHRWGHHNDTLAVWGKLKCMLPQLAAINLQIAGVEVEAMILRENIFRATPTTLAPATATVAPTLSPTPGATLSHTFSPSPGAYAKASPQERCALGCPDWQGSWNLLLAHLELHLSNELVSQVLRSSRLAKL